MKRALIFGGNGYLGRNLAYTLKDRGLSITCIGTGEASDFFPASEYQKADVTCADDLRELDFDVDYVFVFSGITGTNNGFDIYKAFIDVNELGLLNILDRLKTTGSNARLIFPSTRLVFKGVKDKFLSEIDEKEAKTIYAQNKITCEGYLDMYRNYYGIDYTIFRVCVPYGNLVGQSYSYGTIGFFLKQAMSGNDITLFGDGSLRRTYSYVGDISGLIATAIEFNGSINQCFNIGSPDNLSLLEAANLVSEVYDVGVTFVDWPEQAFKVESGDTIFDGSKLEQLTNYKYTSSLSSWLQNLSAKNKTF